MAMLRTDDFMSNRFISKLKLQENQRAFTPILLPIEGGMDKTTYSPS